VLREYFLTLPSIRSSFCLDFDSTAKTLYGNQEGVVKGYNPGHKGKKSYHPLICTEAHRFVVLREKLTEKRKEQLKLLTVDAHAFHVIVTNLALTPFGVFNFYENRAGIERIVRILKDDYPFASAPTKSFIANSVHAELSLEQSVS